MASRVAVVVGGRIDSAEFQRAKAAAEAIGASCPRDVVCEVVPLTEFGWSEYRAGAEAKSGAPVREVTEGCLITVDGGYQASAEKFLEWVAGESFGYAEPASDWAAVAKAEQDAFLADKDAAFVYFDVVVGDEEAAEKMVFRLDKKTCPKTTANFVALCVGVAPSAPPHLGYADTIFHRVQEGGWLQGGDVCTSAESGSFDLAGTGGASIWGATFADENFIVEHGGRGVLSMANSGIHTNGSQFCVSFRALPWMDRKYVAFGKLVSGTAVLDKLEACPTANGRPTKACRVTGSGVFPAADLVTLKVSCDIEDTGVDCTVSASFNLHGKWTVPMAVKGSAEFAGVFREATEAKFGVPGDVEFKVSQVSWDGADKLKAGCTSKELDGKTVAL